MTADERAGQILKRCPNLTPHGAHTWEAGTPADAHQVPAFCLGRYVAGRVLARPVDGGPWRDVGTIDAPAAAAFAASTVPDTIDPAPLNWSVPGWAIGKPRTEEGVAMLRAAGFTPLPGWPPAEARTVDQVDADRYRWGTT